MSDNYRLAEAIRKSGYADLCENPEFPDDTDAAEVINALVARYEENKCGICYRQVGGCKCPMPFLPSTKKAIQNVGKAKG